MRARAAISAMLSCLGPQSRIDPDNHAHAGFHARHYPPATSAASRDGATYHGTVVPRPFPIGIPSREEAAPLGKSAHPTLPSVNISLRRTVGSLPHTSSPRNAAPSESATDRTIPVSSVEGSASAIRATSVRPSPS